MLNLSAFILALLLNSSFSIANDNLEEIKKAVKAEMESKITKSAAQIRKDIHKSEAQIEEINNSINQILKLHGVDDKEKFNQLKEDVKEAFKDKDIEQIFVNLSEVTSFALGVSLVKGQEIKSFSALTKLITGKKYSVSKATKKKLGYGTLVLGTGLIIYDVFILSPKIKDYAGKKKSLEDSAELLSTNILRLAEAELSLAKHKIDLNNL